MNSIVEIKERLLIHEAKRWLSIAEMGGNNRGQLVELFQKAVDGVAMQEPWCMAFVQYCISSVDGCYEAAFGKDSTTLRSSLIASEHCLTVWNKCPGLQIKTPTPGSLCLWQMHKNGKPTAAGHVGIVVDVENEKTILTIEGNTSAEDAVQREGDGVWLKRRQYQGDPNGNMRIKGFLRVWQPV